MQALPRSNQFRSDQSLSNQSLIARVEERIGRQAIAPFDFNANGDLRRISAVLFLLGNRGSDQTPYLILNKRSHRVRQPGDLCCPGGGVSPWIDALIAKSLHLPKSPIAQWRHETYWRRHRPIDYKKLSLLLATALREGVEEMRLNPFGIRFLGPMQPQELVMFKRAIYPLVGWVNRQHHFFPNWEVEKIIWIPLASFFDDANYARYRISFNVENDNGERIPDREMPCFVHRHEGQEELLWGATYRIAMRFFSTVFDYTPPPIKSLPVVYRQLGERYLHGSVVGSGSGENRQTRE